MSRPFAGIETADLVDVHESTKSAIEGGEFPDQDEGLRKVLDATTSELRARGIEVD